MSLQFLVIAGPDKDRLFTLQPGTDLMMGRSPHSLYHLSDMKICRSHCQIVLENEQATLLDPENNGTQVNGVKVSRQVLKVGDIIALGDTQMRLQQSKPKPPKNATPAPAPAEPEVVIEVTPKDLEMLSGQMLSHYRVGSVVGAGRCTVVFEAADTKTREMVALKVLLPQLAHTEEEIQRFVKAMKTLLHLSHPNLITLYGAGKSGQYCWVAEEYVTGEPLANIIKEGRKTKSLDWRLAFQVALHIGRALSYAQEHNLVHGHINPQNILLEADSRTAKLSDLVLARVLEEEMAEHGIHAGEMVGDVDFMSPERTRGLERVDHRSDLFSLGATVYALLTGRPPFEAETPLERITRIRKSDPFKPSKFQPDIPPEFETVVLKMLAKKAAERYQTASELLVQLEPIAQDHAVEV
jgi:serine/threonine protein kinase